MTSTTLPENEVENYLKENIGKNVSLRKLHKDLKISRRKILLLINKSKNISIVKPLDVGSRAFFLHVYTYEAPNLL
jgi:predicted AAA+ superfamily ATPase